MKLTFHESQVLIRALADHHFVEAYLAGKKMLDDAHITGPTCEATKEDNERISDWVSIFEEPSRLIKTVSKNTLRHKKHVDADVDEFKDHYHNREWFKAGEIAADIVYWTVGPV